MNFFDAIKRTRQIDGKCYWIIDEIMDYLGITREVHRQDVPRKSQAWLSANGFEPRKIFQIELGDWAVLESGLIGVVGCLIPFWGDIEHIKAAKVAFGLMNPEPSVPTLAVVDKPEPAPIAHSVSNALAVFSYQSKQVRTQIIDGEPWFVAKDVCDVLGVSDSRKSVNLLDEDERNTVPVIDSLGRSQHTQVVNEPGLYSLILRSRKPEAKSFKRWITHEVIPTIRKTGSYSATPAPALPTDYKSALVALLAEVEKTEQQKSVILELTPKAEFHDRVTDASGCHSINAAAKIIGTGQKRLFTFLYQQKILMRGSRLPYQQYKDKGYFQVVETPWVDTDGDDRLGYTTMVTGKGLIWIQKKWDKALEENRKIAA